MIVVPHDRGFTLSSRAGLLDESTHLQAWAERHVRKDPDLRWVLGNYVEADEANSNGHIFPLSELVRAQHTLAAKPLNMLHREHYIVGSFAGAQLLTSEGAEVTEADVAVMERQLAAAETKPPYIEALAGMWHNRFPEEYFNIKKAHAEGSLFFSMEAIPLSVSCPTCAVQADFAGSSSDTYCEHMNGPVGTKVLHDPNFCGGAIIIPPVKPGWSRADITAISKLIQERPEEAETIYNSVAEEAPHLEPKEWELMMAELLSVVEAKKFPADKRDKLSKVGKAMPDGSFPIENAQDLRNAIKAVGRAKNPAAAKAHIRKRAKALGLTKLLPPNF